jgi:predicted molibdopterin-dependent oxidoreductase YjgC
MPQVIINGTSLEVPEGFTVLQAARQAGIQIPTLCDHPDLTPHGGCRMCVVEVKGARNPLTACTLPATDGMQVETETSELIHARQTILELLLSNYYDAGYASDAAGENELLQWAHYYGVDAPSKMRTEPRYDVNSDPNPFVWVDRNKCIVCTRCVRACAEIQGRFVWGLEQRGIHNHIEAGSGTDLLDARCESCGACVAYCPTGALSLKPSIEAGKADKKVTTTCTYCGVGCNLNLEVKDNLVIRVSSNPDAPVNGMRLCVKGRFGYDFIHHDDRLTQPMVRQYLLDGGERPEKADRGPWVEVDWDTALDIAARKLAETRDNFGADSVGVLTSAKLTNEENYLVNKFARQVIGTNSIDHCARL